MKDRDIDPGFAAVKRKGGGRDSITTVNRRRVGRPPKAVKPIASVAGTPSILIFLLKEKVMSNVIRIHTIILISGLKKIVVFYFVL